ncbi:MAG TPA: TMEM175 family protein [Acidimicrobiales bacterium]|nr:TMEM175 family protein [Acidimicrobiales bacterium]
MALSDTDRLESFSDGVMAVVITIMAFEIKAPGAPSWSALHHTLPDLLVYVLSFTVIGIYWNNHHHLLRATGRMGGAVMWANLHLLFWLSLLPFVTSWVAHFPLHTVPAACYGVLGLGAALAYWVLVRTILRANGADSVVARAIGTDRKGRASLALYALGVGLSVLTPVAAYACYVAVAVLWFVPDRRLLRPPAPGVASPGS